MIKFKDIFNEKTNIKYNKGIKIVFNDYLNHSLNDKLNRSNITDKEFKSVLNKITKKIKQDNFSSGNYNFIFTKFKLPCTYNKDKKELFISTILTKNMVVKSGDKRIVMEEINNIEYINIFME